MSKVQIRHRFFRSIIILFGIFVVVSCGTSPTVIPTTTSPSTATMTRPAPTATPQAETATPAISPTPAPTTPPFTDCQKIIDAQWPKDFLTEGSIIFNRECLGKQGLYKLSAATHKIEPFLETILKDNTFPNFTVSNDRQWLAITNPSYNANNDHLSNTVIFTGENDKSIIQYTMNRDWNYGDGWYKDGLFGIFPWIEGSLTKYFLNPFTGEVSKFDYYDKDVNFYSVLFLDPMMTHAVYGNQPSHKFTDYIYKELKTGRILWQNHSKADKWSYTSSPGDYASDLAWSPSGKYFALAIWQADGVFKFMAVDRDGKETITNELFNQAYQTWFNTIDFQWSSTGKYLCFWSKIDQEKSQLVLWMPETNQIIYPGIQTTSDFSIPEFSPDDQKFVLHTMTNGSRQGEGANFLEDLSSGKITKFDVDLGPIAWLKTKREMTRSVTEPFPLMPKSGASVKQVVSKVQPLNIKLLAGGLIFFRNNYLYIFTRDGERKLVDTEFMRAMTAYVSPNQKELFYLYQDETRDRYWLYTLDKQPTEVFTDRIDSTIFRSDVISGWQNDRELWTIVRYQLGDRDNLALFNVFENSFRFPPEFKMKVEFALCWVYCAASGDPPAWLYNNYDNAFERRVYIGPAPVIQDQKGNVLAHYADFMADRNGNVLWQYAHDLVGFNMPKWSPDDQKLGVPLPNDEAGEHYEIFTVDRDGHQRQLTNYKAAYPAMTIDKFSWSPNGRYIAFWGDTHSRESIAAQNPYRLFVLDTVTHQTVDYCVAGDYVSQSSDHRAPTWSPDGKQIAVNGLLDGKRQILLVDFAAGTVTPVTDGELVGWMAEK